MKKKKIISTTQATLTMETENNFIIKKKAKIYSILSFLKSSRKNQRF